MTSESESQPPPQPAQQSWTAWFLDAYVNSAVESHEDLTDDSAYESMSPGDSDGSIVETSSPYGPYVKTGRGGAGNYQWQSQQNSDLEAQKPIGLKEKRKAALKIEHIDTAAAVKNAQSRKTSQYAYRGRGGAGNVRYIQSNEPQPSPTATTFVRSPVSANSPVTYSGRGGAGNYGAVRSTSESVKLAKEREEQAEAEHRREQAEHQVSSLLQPPTQAYTGSRRRSALPDDVEPLTWS